MNYEQANLLLEKTARKLIARPDKYSPYQCRVKIKKYLHCGEKQHRDDMWKVIGNKSRSFHEGKLKVYDGIRHYCNGCFKNLKSRTEFKIIPAGTSEQQWLESRQTFNDYVATLDAANQHQ